MVAAGAGAEAPAPRRGRPPLPLVVGGLVASVIVLIPITYIVIRATERGWGPIEATLWRPRTLELLLRSVWLAVVVTAVCGVLGVGGAWLVTRTDLPGRRLWRVALAVPLALPSYVAGWAWIGWSTDLAGFRGAALVLITISYPYVYLPVLGAFRRADPALAEVARASGLGPLRVFLFVTLRQVRIAALGGSILVVLYVLSDFGAVSLMRHETLTHVIYQSYRASFDRTPAAVLGCLLVAVTLLPLLLAVSFGERERIARVGAGTGREAPVVHLGRWRWPALAAVSGLLAMALGLPAATLVRWVARGTSRAAWIDVAETAATTLWLGLLAALATVVIAFPVGVLAARHPGRFSRGVTTVAYAGYALPGIVVALSLVFFGIRFATPIYQRTPMLVGAYVVIFLSLAIGAVHSAVAQAPPVLDDVARSLGSSQWRVWQRVTLPLAAPGIGAGAALVCIAVMKELPATLLLRPIGSDTLATRLWSLTDEAQFAAAAPYAAVLVLIAAVPTALLTRASLESRS